MIEVANQIIWYCCYWNTFIVDFEVWHSALSSSKMIFSPSKINCMPKFVFTKYGWTLLNFIFFGNNKYITLPFCFLNNYGFSWPSFVLTAPCSDSIHPKIVVVLTYNFRFRPWGWLNLFFTYLKLYVNIGTICGKIETRFMKPWKKKKRKVMILGAVSKPL